MRPEDLRRLFTLAGLWGGSFLFMRIAVPVLGGVMTAWLRMGIASLTLALYFAVTKPKLELRERAVPYFVLGLLNSAAPFALFCSAELRLSASMGAILNATTPLFSSVFSAHWMSEPLTKKKTLGIVIAMSGVVLLVGWSPLQWNRPTELSIAAAMSAAALYAVGGIYAKRHLSGAPSAGMALGSQIGGFLWLLPLIPFSVPTVAPTLPAIACLTALGVLSTALAYLLFFRLLVDVGPAKTLTVTFLVPMFGVFWATLFLHEPLTFVKVISCGVILIGTAIVTGFLPRTRQSLPT